MLTAGYRKIPRRKNYIGKLGTVGALVMFHFLNIYYALHNDRYGDSSLFGSICNFLCGLKYTRSAFMLYCTNLFTQPGTACC